MRHINFLLLLVFLVSCKTKDPMATIKFAENKVVAHRGAWKTNNLPENSIAALRHAIELKCTGSEFDVRMTSDDVLIVTHDKDYNSLLIEENTYAELSKKML